MNRAEDTPVAPFFDGTQLCAETDPDMWFPGQERQDIIPLLKRICDQCEFKRPCLIYAIKTDQQGVWAGTNHVERRKLAVKHNIEVTPLDYDYH